MTVLATIAELTVPLVTAPASGADVSGETTIIAPFQATRSVGDYSPTFTATTIDASGNPVPGVTYHWATEPRNIRTHTGPTFRYRDTASWTPKPGDRAADQIELTAIDRDGNNLYDEALLFWVTEPVQAVQVNGDLDPFSGQYVKNASGIFVPSGFTKSATADVTADPDADGAATVARVGARLAGADGIPLDGDQVTFSLSGVGEFTDVDGHPLAGPTSTSAVSCTDYTTSFHYWPRGNGMTDDTCNVSGAATAFVRSTVPGTATVTVSADGVTDQVHITFVPPRQYVPLSPRRVLDLYGGSQAVVVPKPFGRLDADQLYDFYFGRRDTLYVPPDAQALVFNVTAILTGRHGNLRVAPLCDQGSSVPSRDVPGTSLINYQGFSKTVANLIVVPEFCTGLRLYSASASSALAIDLVGYYPAANAISPLDPTRVADTRAAQGGSGPIAANTSRSFQISGRGGIPAGAEAVALNVAAVTPAGEGNLRIYPDGSAVPNASNINYIPGVDKASFVVVKLPADGKIDVYSAASAADVVIDAYAYYPTTSNLVTRSPVRVLDTRNPGNGGSLRPGKPRDVQVTGLAGVPSDAQAVLVTVTAIHTVGSTAKGNLRVSPAGEPIPYASTLNYVCPTCDVANFAITKLGTGGRLTLWTALSPEDVTIDVVGYVPAEG